MSTAKKTHPDLWEEVKDELKRSDKGGEPGEWSARKAQLAVQEYKRRGGGYEGKKKADNDLKQWTDEEWGTKSGKKSKKTGERYLPKKARDALTDEEYRRTTAKKRSDDADGKQFSDQPDDIAAKTAKHRGGGGGASGETADEPTKGDLMKEARALDVDGRSQMSKADLADAVEEAKARQQRLEALKKSELADAAQTLGITGASSKTKAGLREAIRDALAKTEPDDLSKSSLSDLATTFEVEGRSRMGKADLLKALKGTVGAS